MNKTNFQKKIYRTFNSPSFSESASPSTITQYLREELKTFFLPLLIDIRELRKTIDHYQSDFLKTVKKSLEQILKRFKKLQEDIEAIRSWCDGVIVQIAKGVKETKGALGKKNNLLKRIFRRIAE